MSELKTIEDLMPADTPRHMLPAWLGCISWALGETDCVEAFRHDTGIQWKPASSPLERMIDEATNAERHFIEAFIRWANVNVWGPLDGGDGDEPLGL